MFSFRPQKPDISEENEVKIETNCLEDDLYESIFHEEIYNVELPKNFDDVQQSQEKRNWIKAMEDELKVMKDRKVWKLVNPPPQDQTLLDWRWPLWLSCRSDPPGPALASHVDQTLLDRRWPLWLSCRSDPPGPALASHVDQTLLDRRWPLWLSFRSDPPGPALASLALMQIRPSWTGAGLSGSHMSRTVLAAAATTGVLGYFFGLKDTSRRANMEPGIMPVMPGSKLMEASKYGLPSRQSLRVLQGYIVAYDQRTRIPSWVFEHLTPESLRHGGEGIDRSKSEFHEDSHIHQFFRAVNADYKGSGYDRGHMAAAGNHRSSQQELDETFLLTNMAPQVGKGFNRDIWNSLERYVRKMAKNYRNTFVCTGPLFLPRLEADGNLYVRYKVIGKNNIAVPSHYFKVIVMEAESGELHLETYVLPNTPIPDSTSLHSFLIQWISLARKYGVGNATISDIKKNSDAITNYASALDNEDGSLYRKAMKMAENKDLDAAVYTWFMQLHRKEGRII
ncbi:ENDOG [Cordylochernes scorpioides]|uniref:ENDOG n=1 Tax=Cordylochernes scorpioides TaxID=51811 RepID=A0ABY6KCH0_9ARAC|nr:ENDOG [Cordylochernes scorpioides]